MLLKDFIVGGLKPEVKSMLGLTEDIKKVMNGMLGQCGSAIGTGNIVPGILTETIGTAKKLK